MIALLTCALVFADLVVQPQAAPTRHSASPSTDELTEAQLRKLVYDAEVVSIGETGERVRIIKQQPDVGLKLVDGFLLGSDRGEWGGELVFSEGRSRTATLLKENVTAIHRLSFGIVVVTGIAHLTIDEGALYLVQSRGHKSYLASRWKILPGAPERSELLSDGSMFISCSRGAVVVTPEGELKKASKSKRH